MRTTELFNFINTLATVGITWWVSATVLCAAIIGGAWLFRTEVRLMKPKTLKVSFWVISTFFFTIILFGAMVVIGSFELGDHLSEACEAVKEAGSCTREDAILITRLLAGGFTLGTTSFIACLVAFCYLWVEIRHSPQEPESGQEVGR